MQRSSFPVFLLHGLGVSPATLWPLEKYLRLVGGFMKTYRISYPADIMEFEDMVNIVDREMMKLADKKTDKVVVIGQSLGGVVANKLHTRGWQVCCAVYIGAPLNGARLIRQVETRVPKCLKPLLYKLMYERKKKPYDYLRTKTPATKPPHNYHTISMAWPFTGFDGCVYKDETIIEEKKHTHLPCTDHRGVFINPRLWVKVLDIIRAYTTTRTVSSVAGVPAKFF